MAASSSGSWRRVVDLARQLVQHLGVFELPRELVELVDVGLDVGVLGVDLLGLVLVVPQVGAGNLVLELGQPRAVGVDLEIAVGLAETATQFLQIVGEITHGGETASRGQCRGSRRATAREPPTRREQSKRSGDQSRPSVEPRRGTS